LAALSLRTDDDVPRRLGLFLALASANGLAPNAAELAAQMAPAHVATMPSAALWLAVRQAQAAHRRGELALAAILLAQDGERLAAEPVTLLRSLDALRAAGLEGDARALSRDAAIAAGL
jgi:hypothetical protein